MRAVIAVTLAANLLIAGPLAVGLPSFAFSRLPEGAAAYGTLLAAFGAGSLVGLSAGALLPTPRATRLGTTVMLTLAVAGLALAALALAASTLIAAALSLAAGVGIGYGNLLGLTWIQSRIAPELMGRVMSLMMMGSMGLVPVSMLIAGVTVEVSLDGTFVVAGLGMAAMSVISLLSPAVRNLGLEPKHGAASAIAPGRETTVASSVQAPV